MPDSSIAIIFVIIEQQLNNKASWALYILSAANITDANSTEGSAGKKKKKVITASSSLALTQKKIHIL